MTHKSAPRSKGGLHQKQRRHPITSHLLLLAALVLVLATCMCPAVASEDGLQQGHDPHTPLSASTHGRVLSRPKLVRRQGPGIINPLDPPVSPKLPPPTDSPSISTPSPTPTATNTTTLTIAPTGTNSTTIKPITPTQTLTQTNTRTLITSTSSTSSRPQNSTTPEPQKDKPKEDDSGSSQGLIIGGAAIGGLVFAIGIAIIAFRCIMNSKDRDRRNKEMAATLAENFDRSDPIGTPRKGYLELGDGPATGHGANLNRQGSQDPYYSNHKEGVDEYYNPHYVQERYGGANNGTHGMYEETEMSVIGGNNGRSSPYMDHSVAYPPASVPSSHYPAYSDYGGQGGQGGGYGNGGFGNGGAPRGPQGYLG